MNNEIKKANKRKQIYLATEDNKFRDELIESVEQKKFTIKVFSSISDLEKACKLEMPIAIVADIDFEKDEVVNSDCLCGLKDEGNKCPPLICISEQQDIKSRLKVARIGARRYFTKPVNVNEISSSIENLTTRELMDPYKVLLVDDDKDLLRFYKTALSEEGLNVRTLNRPLDSLQVMSDFKPDVMVIDVYMPECTGPELAQVIRQDNKWTMLPIMFLSADTDADYQISAMHLGADDFLLKPVKSSYLVAAIVARAKRARKTNQLNNELKIALRENKFQLVAMNEHDIVSTADVAGRITHVNDKFSEISGYSRNELIGQNHRMLKSGEHSAKFYVDMWKTISQGKVWHGVICNRKKTGDKYWVESTIVPFLDNQGKPYKFVSARTDITELRMRGDRLDRSQGFAKIGTWDWNIITGELYWSDRIWPLFGYRKEITGTTYENFLEAVYSEDRKAVINAVNACVEKGQEYNIEHRVAWPDGSIHWVQESGDVVRDENGKALNMLGVVQDIDKRKRVEISLAESEQKLREAQAIARIGNWQINYETDELSWSDEVYRIIGQDSGSFRPGIESYRKTIHPDDLLKYVENWKRAEDTGKHDVVYRIIRPDGEVRYVHELAKSQTDYSGKLLSMTGTIQDITERIETEEKLANQKKLIDKLHMSTMSFVQKGDFRGAMDGMLDTLLELTDSDYGFTGEVYFEEDGSPYMITRAITNIAWDEETQSLYDEYAEKGFEFRNLNTLFGQVMVSGDAVISNEPVSDPRSGGLPEGHPEMKNFMGVPIFYGKEMIGMYGMANRDKGYDEELMMYLKPFDITCGAMIQSNRMIKKEEESRREIIEAKEEAENANRSKSKFLSSMSHELRTPMNAIMGFSQLLKMDSKNLSGSQSGSVEEIIKAGDHLLKLINEVLDLAKIEAGSIDLSIETISLSGVVAESLQLIAPLAQKRGIEINLFEKSVEISLQQLIMRNSAVRADHVRLRQVLLNLLSNAVKYNNENGYINIACDYVENKRIRISVTDSGKGLTEEQQKKLFKAFNRLGAEQSDIEGTGIGLVITKNIIELMGGDIGVDCKPGEGCCFWVELSSVENEIEQKIMLDEVALSGQESIGKDAQNTVLYVEDNPANLRLVSQLFNRRENIHMWSAHEPLLGLELAAEHCPDLILLDINLPGMDGYEVLKMLRQREATSETPVIAISANAMPGDIEKGLQAGFDNYITKPINITELLKAVDEKLSR